MPIVSDLLRQLIELSVFDRRYSSAVQTNPGGKLIKIKSQAKEHPKWEGGVPLNIETTDTYIYNYLCL